MINGEKTECCEIMMIKIGFEPEPTKGFLSKIKLERGKGTYDKQKYNHRNNAGPRIIN